MLTPFTDPSTRAKVPDLSVPEVVPIEELTGEEIEAAEAQIEAEEEEWPQTV